MKFYWHKYKYFPYEKDLAARELISIYGLSPSTFSNGLEIQADLVPESVFNLTYFRKVERSEREAYIPLQTLLETSVNGQVSKNKLGVKKQSTRYSAHGIHEYRGKFNPQLVRAIGNIIGIKTGDWIIDPFCGSGTTLLEAFHNNWNAVGVDINPLAIEITKAKIASVTLTERQLDSFIDGLTSSLTFGTGNLRHSNTIGKKQGLERVDWKDYLPGFDYLHSWFTQHTLKQLSIILREIDNLKSEKEKIIAKVVLSDLVRFASLQDPYDLRIRRRKDLPKPVNLIKHYVEALEKRIERVKIAKTYIAKNTTSQHAFLGDAKKLSELFNGKKHPDMGFDGAITSPPYATGLPYIDTDRLSLVVLGLIDAKDIHKTQKSLIGNREITTGEREATIKAINLNASDLPSETMAFCRFLTKSVGKNDGFRRQNVPAVLYKYFLEMAESFTEIRNVLKSNSPYALVVGPNKTRLNGRQIIIDTPRLLVDIAISRGFKLIETIELNTYQRFDIHKNNSIQSESLLILRAD